jgi:hypothetical protein
MLETFSAADFPHDFHISKSRLHTGTKPIRADRKSAFIPILCNTLVSSRSISRASSMTLPPGPRAAPADCAARWPWWGGGLGGLVTI